LAKIELVPIKRSVSGNQTLKYSRSDWNLGG
jgi:hypothetical protein